jgi:hypothetical protein
MARDPRYDIQFEPPTFEPPTFEPPTFEPPKIGPVTAPSRFYVQ